jgi:hypothetical protein
MPDWIRRRLGLWKTELPGQPGVLPRTLYPMRLGHGSPPQRAGDSWVIAPAPHGRLLEEVGEPEDEETRRPKEQTRESWPQKIKAKIFIVYVARSYIL